MATYKAMVAGRAALACASGAAGGGCLTGRVYGWYSGDCLTSKYEEFTRETTKLNAALQSLKGKQQKQKAQFGVKEKQIDLMRNLKQT